LSYSREQVDAALTYQSEITPHLIRLLDEVLAEPSIILSGTTPDT